MLRVGDPQRSIDFYAQALGVSAAAHRAPARTIPVLAVVGYGSNPSHAELRLTYNRGASTATKLAAALRHHIAARRGPTPPPPGAAVRERAQALAVLSPARPGSGPGRQHP